MGSSRRMGKCQLGYVIGLTSSSLTGPRHVLQSTSRFIRKVAMSSAGGSVYALCEMVGLMSLLRDFFAPLEGLEPGTAGLEDCGSLFTLLKTGKKITEKYLARHFLGNQLAAEWGRSG